MIGAAIATSCRPNAAATPITTSTIARWPRGCCAARTRAAPAVDRKRRIVMGVSLLELVTVARVVDGGGVDGGARRATAIRRQVGVDLDAVPHRRDFGE